MHHPLTEVLGGGATGNRKGQWLSRWLYQARESSSGSGPGSGEVVRKRKIARGQKSIQSQLFVPMVDYLAVPLVVSD